MSRQYFLGKTPVTWAMWDEYVGAGGYQAKKPSFPGLDGTHPVVNVSWEDCMKFCAWASSVSRTELSLPTEAQWERAARGGEENLVYPWGDSRDISKYGCNDKGTESVNRSKNVFMNAYGLVDLSGNVRQWCSDWFGPYTASPQTNPMGPSSGRFRILRGGSWGSDVEECRCGFRTADHPAYRNDDVGFRLRYESP